MTRAAVGKPPDATTVSPAVSNADSPGADPAPVRQLNTEFVKALRSQEIKGKWKVMDFETLPSTPKEFARFAAADSKLWAEAVKISGFKASE